MLSFSFGLLVVFAYIGVKVCLRECFSVQFCRGFFGFTCTLCSLLQYRLGVSVFLSPVHAAGTVARGFLRYAFFSLLFLYN